MNNFNRSSWSILLLASLLISFFGCQSEKKRSLQVTATAYNSVASQTTFAQPTIAAWGDTLIPGMKVIAVSRDLIDSGLVHNKAVYLEGFEGAFLVKDKLNRRYTKRIDIYMGLDVKKARDWGKQKLSISWVEVEKK
jgi:3D (Asp-Asp-Asp) domain-containing protein